jgi:hypothetical protein
MVNKGCEVEKIRPHVFFESAEAIISDRWPFPNTPAVSSDEDIRAIDGKREGKRIRQSWINCLPAYAIIGGKKSTIAGSGKNILARDCKAMNGCNLHRVRGWLPIVQIVNL